MEHLYEDLDIDPDTGFAKYAGESANGDFYVRGRDGALISVIGYLDGNREGWDRDYYPDGTLKHEGRWDDGTPVGIHRYWYANGHPGSEEEWEGGWVVRSRSWREDGTLKYETPVASQDSQDG